jgi:hypothetical protein
MEVSMPLSRRALITSALATAAAGMGTATAFGDETPTTILQLQRRSIEVSGKSASVYGIRQPNGTAGITARVGDRFRVRVENQIDAPSRYCPEKSPERDSTSPLPILQSFEMDCYR